jgi:hypothetical protein
MGTILFSQTNKTILIRPQLIYSTYLGGSGNDGENNWLTDFSFDDYGIVCFAVDTYSSDFPVTDNAYDKSYNGGHTEWGEEDNMLVKFNIEQNELVYASYFGGSSGPEFISQVVLHNNSLFLAGNTGSSDFPISVDAYDPDFNGPVFRHADIFFSRFDSDELTYSTYIGTSGNEFFSNILINNNDEIIIVGQLKEWDEFEFTNQFSNEKLNDLPNLCVFKFNPKGDSLLISSLFGPCYSITAVIDDEGYIYIAGSTSSAEFPVTNDAYDIDYNGGNKSSKGDFFVMKLSSQLDEIIFSTYLGGSDDEYYPKICLDQNKNIIIYGATESNDFLISENAVDKSFDGTSELIIAKLSKDGKHLFYSSFIGGNQKTANGEFVGNIISSTKGDIYICGKTDADDHPITQNAISATNNGGTDIFITVFDSTLADIQYSTYIGGSTNEMNPAIALDEDGNIICVGATNSSDFPTTQGAFAENKNGESDIVLFKLSNIYEIEGDYFGQIPPQDLPVQFMAYPSDGNWPILHSSPSFSPSGNEAFWATIPDFSSTTQSIYCRKRKNGQWFDPIKVSFSDGRYSDKLPSFSGDGKRVYFTSNRPRTGNENPIDDNIWYIEKTDTGWSQPIYLDNPINTSQNEGWISVTANNNIYFGRDNKLYFAEWDEDNFLAEQALPEYPSNMGVLGCIAPDESYFIIQSDYTQNSSDEYTDDLYIIFNPKKDNPTPIKLDSKINSMRSKSFAKISPDGKYLFFLGNNNVPYWVSTNFIQTITGIETGNRVKLPNNIRLEQNYPNPFNPSTKICYSIKEPGEVKLEIFDSLGQHVKTLVNNYQTTGKYSVIWNGTDNSNNSLCSGVYFYSLFTNNKTLHKKMILLR